MGGCQPKRSKNKPKNIYRQKLPISISGEGEGGDLGLAFQPVQEALLQGLSALPNLVGKLVKDITDGRTQDTRQSSTT